MNEVVKFLNKLKPQWADMLVFYFPQDSPKVEPPVVNGIDLKEEGNEFIFQENGLLIHRSRVFYKSNFLSNFNFSGPLITIGDCFTDDRYRGKGIYPQVLKYLGSKFSPERQVFILVAPENLSSIKGIEKAGFIFLGRLQGLRILIFYFFKKLSISRL
ncbi:hypothetical protein DFQ04_1439 [Algoriphagus boseongensis]|uniref:Acetyltransferase (GNAT) family protein n=1 Tax=Algoriphagus boseongensis TaxID=1442587 RepID=A0A4R6TD02_9BACT|nr:hypothetical protein DFQ04_1439 [Algoriphagus boseongensis]